jgi:phosphoglycolate phosphatase
MNKVAALGVSVNRPRVSSQVNRLGRFIRGMDDRTVRMVYADLDGTLLGPGGSLFAGGDGPTMEPALALGRLARAGVDVVLVSGRTQPQVREVARTIGAAGYIAELGGLIAFRDEGREVTVRNRGAFTGAGTPYAAIVRSGAAGALLAAYERRLEPHAPWAFLERECSVLLRGFVELAQARATLGEWEYGWLDLLDNGIIPSWPGRFPGLDADEVHAYHLVPLGVSKRTAVALDRARRGLRREECVAVGDSASDAEIAPEVGEVFIVANGRTAVQGLALPGKVRFTERAHGLGFADAVRAFVPLPERG